MCRPRGLDTLTFQRLPACGRDAEAKDLDGLATDAYFRLCRHKPLTGKTGKHFGRELIRYEDRVAEATRNACE